jgi:hypothetical protein
MLDWDAVNSEFYESDIFILENDTQQVYAVNEPLDYDFYNYEISVVLERPLPKLDKRGHLPIIDLIRQI